MFDSAAVLSVLTDARVADPQERAARAEALCSRLGVSVFGPAAVRDDVLMLAVCDAAVRQMTLCVAGDDAVLDALLADAGLGVLRRGERMALLDGRL